MCSRLPESLLRYNSCKFSSQQARSKLAQPIKTVPAAPDARHATTRHATDANPSRHCSLVRQQPHCDTIGTSRSTFRARAHPCLRARAGGLQWIQPQHEPIPWRNLTSPIRQLFIHKVTLYPFLASQSQSHHPLTYYSPATVFSVSPLPVSPK